MTKLKCDRIRLNHVGGLFEGTGGLKSNFEDFMEVFVTSSCTPLRYGALLSLLIKLTLANLKYWLSAERSWRKDQSYIILSYRTWITEKFDIWTFSSLEMPCSTTYLLLSLGGDDLGASLSRRFGFCSHGSCELLWQTDVLHFYSLYLKCLGRYVFTIE